MASLIKCKSKPRILRCFFFHGFFVLILIFIFNMISFNEIFKLETSASCRTLKVCKNCKVNLIRAVSNDGYFQTQVQFHHKSQYKCDSMHMHMHDLFQVNAIHETCYKCFYFNFKIRKCFVVVAAAASFLLIEHLIYCNKSLELQFSFVNESNVMCEMRHHN